MGYPHPRYLQELISSEDFAEWVAYSELEPFGSLAAELRCARICCTIANVNRVKGQRPLEVRDFLPRCYRHVLGPVNAPEQTLEEQKAVIQQLVAVAKKRGRLKHRKRPKGVQSR